MAAILFNACYVQPCQACSGCCNKCAKALAPFCEGLCGCFKDACQWFNNVFSEPLSCFLILAIAWMGAAGIVSILALVKDLDGCAGPMTVWFIVAVLECIVHVLYAIYCFTRIHNRQKAMENYFMVLYQLLVFDPWTAFYIVFDIFGVVWSFLGFSWNNNCPDSVSTNSSLVAYGLLFYIAVSYFAMISNLFSASVQNDLCFCFWCLPFMMFPCCFGPSLRRNYESQKTSYQPAFQGGNNGTQEAKHGQNYQWHPVAPQVSRRPETQNINQGETPVLRQAVGAVGSFLWNKAMNRSNRRDNIARV